MLKTRVIIVPKGCNFCKTYIKILNNQKFPFETYDGDVKENQDDLDKWKVNAFPVVQIIDGNKVVHQFPYRQGGWAPRLIKGKMAELERKRGK